MPASEEFLQMMDSKDIADKDAVLRARHITGKICSVFADPAKAQRYKCLLDDAFLNIQMAVVAGNEGLLESCKTEGRALLEEIQRHQSASQAEVAERPGPSLQS